jgi:hypothetical protein
MPKRKYETAYFHRKEIQNETFRRAGSSGGTEEITRPNLGFVKNFLGEEKQP